MWMVSDTATGSSAAPPGEWVEEGPYVDGERHGHWVIRGPAGSVEEGPYVDGELHGHWVSRDSDGRVYESIYENGELVKEERVN